MSSEPVDAVKCEADTDLPKSVVRRIVKTKLAGVTTGKEGKQKDIQLNKEALLALAESGKVFISWLTSTANDIAQERKRQTISADDVFAALEDLDFQDLGEPLKEALEAFRTTNREKNKKRLEAAKKRKAAGANDASEDAHAAPAAEEGSAEVAHQEDGGGGMEYDDDESDGENVRVTSGV